MTDEDYEKIYPHKKGDILTITNYPQEEMNEWVIKEYLCGGYELKNTYDGSTIRVETRFVDFAKAPLDKIDGHRGHEVIETFTWHPDDKFLYCRTCKKEVKSKYKKF